MVGCLLLVLGWWLLLFWFVGLLACWFVGCGVLCYVLLLVRRWLWVMCCIGCLSFVVCCLMLGGWCLVFGVFSFHRHWLLVVGCNTSFIVRCVLFVCEWSLVVVCVC